MKCFTLTDLAYLDPTNRRNNAEFMSDYEKVVGDGEKRERKATEERFNERQKNLKNESKNTGAEFINYLESNK